MKRLVLAITAGAGILGLGVVVIIHALVYRNTTARRHAPGPDPSFHGLYYETARIASRDGLILSAWFIPGRPGAPSILVAHGLSSDRSGILPVVLPLHDAGYSLLIPDMRAHGASGGSMTTFGPRESEDLFRWFDLIKHLDGVDHGRTGGVGFSMGASALAVAGSREPSVRALFLDSTYSNLGRAIETTAEEFYGLPRLLAKGVPWTFSNITGEDPWSFSPETALAARQFPVLLVHATNDRRIPFEGAAGISEILGGRAELISHDRGHLGLISSDPERYHRLLTGFFTEHLPI